MSAILSCGAGAALSHGSAAARLRIGDEAWGIEVSVPASCDRRPAGIVVHQRVELQIVRHRGIPVTPPASTLVDLAGRLSPDELEAAINAADKRDLIDPEALRAALDGFGGQPGVVPLRETLDRRTFTLTDSVLERRFLPLVRRAGLPLPRTREIVNGFKVDFYWPDLGLVVETDGLRYHRTPAQQTKDSVRDQVHAAAGLTTLRFTRAQVTFDPSHVQRTLTAVAQRRLVPRWTLR